MGLAEAATVEARVEAREAEGRVAALVGVRGMEAAAKVEAAREEVKAGVEARAEEEGVLCPEDREVVLAEAGSEGAADSTAQEAKVGSVEGRAGSEGQEAAAAPARPVVASEIKRLREEEPFCQ